MRVLAWVEPATWPAVVDAALALPGASVTLAAVADPRAVLPDRPSPLGSPRRRSRAASDAVTDAARRVLEEAAARALGPGLSTRLLTGPTERVVLEAAREADVLVVARDGDRSRLGPRSLGRDARFIVDHAPCTVVLVWPGDAPPLGTLPPAPPEAD